MVDELSDFFFTSNSTEWQCPDFNGFACTPPAACAQNSTTSRTYCCDAGKLGDVCWTTAVTCATDGSTITCGGQDSYCCLAQGYVNRVSFINEHLQAEFIGLARHAPRLLVTSCT